MNCDEKTVDPNRVTEPIRQILNKTYLKSMENVLIAKIAAVTYSDETIKYTKTETHSSRYLATPESPLN